MISSKIKPPRETNSGQSEQVTWFENRHLLSPSPPPTHHVCLNVIIDVANLVILLWAVSQKVGKGEKGRELGKGGEKHGS